MKVFLTLNCFELITVLDVLTDVSMDAGIQKCVCYYLLNTLACMLELGQTAMNN